MGAWSTASEVGSGGKEERDALCGREGYCLQEWVNPQEVGAVRVEHGAQRHVTAATIGVVVRGVDAEEGGVEEGQYRGGGGLGGWWRDKIGLGWDDGL